MVGEERSSVSDFLILSRLQYGRPGKSIDAMRGQMLGEGSTADTAGATLADKPAVHGIRAIVPLPSLRAVRKVSHTILRLLQLRIDALLGSSDRPGR
jgi:hypothetical protein